MTDWRDEDSIEAAAIRFLCTEGRAKMLTVMKPESCIAASVLGREVLRAFGIDAKPVVVEASVYSPAMAEAIEQGVTGKAMRDVPKAHMVVLGGEDVSALDRWMQERRTGDTYPDGWRIHMALVTAYGILDLSLDQATRPRFDMRVEPGLFLWNDTGLAKFEAGDTVAWKDDESGHVVSYQWRRGDHSYTRSPNWARDRRLMSRMAGAFIRQIRSEWRGAGTTETS